MAYENFVALKGSTPPVPGDHVVAGRIDPAQMVEGVTLILKGQKADRQVLAEARSLAEEPPAARSYLERRQVLATYGPSSRTLAAVKAFAKHFELTLGPAQCGGFLRPISGTAAAMNAAFRMHLRIVRSPEGRLYPLPMTAIHVPSELLDAVRGVSGFLAAPLDRNRFAEGLATGVTTPLLSVFQSRNTRVSSIVKRTPGKGVLSPDVAQYFYNWPPGLTGRGQNIAVLETGSDFAIELVEAYFESFFTIPMPQIRFVPQEKPDLSKPPPVYATEAQLDLQVACPVAPDAQYFMYTLDHYSRASFPLGLLGALGAAVFDKRHPIDVVSISYGYNERSFSRAEADLLNLLLALSGLLGITVVAASGDSGASGMHPGLTPPLSANVNLPAASPYALACGGTSLARNPFYSPRYLREVVWNAPHPRVGNQRGATNGGISTIFKRPDYQLHATLPISANAQVPGISSTGRGVPDVSSNSDSNTGYLIFYRNPAGRPSLGMTGGTSAAAPLWAALVACINEGLGHNVGFLNPALYRLQLDAMPDQGPLNPVIFGNNGGNIEYPSAFYSASPWANWSAACGLGTPDGTRLLEALRTSAGSL